MVKLFKTIGALGILALLLLLFLDLEKSTDLYYYLNVVPSKAIQRATGELVLSQNNIFGLQKRWFMFPVHSLGLFSKIIYIVLLVTVSHLILVRSLANHFKIQAVSVSLFLIFFNYYFFVNGLHLVRQVLAFNLFVASYYIQQKNLKLPLIFISVMMHEIVFFMLPLMLILKNLSFLMRITVLLLMGTLFLEGTKGERLYIVFIYSLYIYIAVSMRKLKLYNVH